MWSMSMLEHFVRKIIMAVQQNILHGSEYSSDGKLYAFLNFDGKLKIWNTESSEFQREFIPKGHLTMPFTCFIWISVDHSIGLQKTSPKKSDQTTEFIALGTKNGGVSLYSFSKGDIECNLNGDGHRGSVTAICRGINNVLFTCGDDCRVILWSLKTGAQMSSWEIGTEEKPSSLVYLTESNRLLVAGRQLYLWSVEREELEQTFTGHSSSVTILKYLVIKSKEYILSASKMDRVLSLWRMKTTKYRPNTYSYLMQDIACNVSCRIEDDDNLKIATVTQSGVLHLYNVEGLQKTIDKPSNKPIKPNVTIEIANDETHSVEPIPIVAASIDFASGVRQKIQIGYGDRQVLHFETIEPVMSEKRQVLIRGDPKKRSTDAAGKKRTANTLKTITPIIEMDKVECQSKGMLTRKGQKIIEIPMETRLENLTFDTSNQNNAKHARNVAQLLVQSLHIHDTNLLRTVFTNQDEQVIRSTLKRLPPQYVGSLVDELTLLAQKKSTHVHTAVIWLKNLLLTQSSQLMSIGTVELYASYGPLLGIFEHRAKLFEQLSKLSGRLDLLVSQIKQNTEEEIVEDTDLLVYEDQEPSDSDDIPNEIEDSSDDQWENDAEEEEEAKREEVDVKSADSSHKELMEIGENSEASDDDDEDDDDDDDDDDDHDNDSIGED